MVMWWSPQWSPMDALNKGWLRKSLGASAATTRTSTVPCSVPSRCGRLASKCTVLPASSRWTCPSNSSRSCPGDDVDPLLAAVAGRLRGRAVGLDADLQRLESRGAREPAAGGDGEPVGLVGHPPGRRDRDGRDATALTEQGAHRHPERPRQRDQGRHRGLAVTRLQAGEVGRGEVGALRQLLQRQAGPAALLAQTLGQGGKGLVELHPGRVWARRCLRGKRLCQSSRFRNIGETVPRSAFARNHIRATPGAISRARAAASARARQAGRHSILPALTSVLKQDRRCYRPASDSRQGAPMFDRLLLALDDSPAGEVATLFACSAGASHRGHACTCCTSTSGSSVATG